MKLLVYLSCGLTSVSIFAFAYHEFARARVAPASPPVRLVVYLLEPEKLLGVVGLNEQVRGSFTLVNDTDTTITLGEPLKTCACTTAVLDRRELGPGERCSLTFVIQTGSRRVPRAEAVNVVYTASDGAGTRQVSGRMCFVPKGVFDIDPTSVTLTRSQPKASFVVRGDPAAGRHKVLDVLSNHRCVKVDTRALPVVTLELDLETPDESILNTECVVYTNNPAEQMITVPVRVRKD